MAISLPGRLRFVTEVTKYPVASNSIFRNNRNKIYLLSCFNNVDHLIKSFTATYIAAKTPRRERIIVKTGLLLPVSLSSFIPPQVVTRIIAIIWNAMPEYLAKSPIPLFPGLFGFFFFCWCSSPIVIVIAHIASTRKPGSRFYGKF